MEQFLKKKNFKLSLYKHGKKLFILRKNHFFSEHRGRKVIPMHIYPQALGRPVFMITYAVIFTSGGYTLPQPIKLFYHKY
jgi:hypothetical protein